MTVIDQLVEIPNTPYCFNSELVPRITELSARVRDLRSTGKLTPEVLGRIRRYFRIKNIYHSNAIEGNQLDVGETRQVVELGLTITGKSLRDQAEAKNLSEALDFLEDLAADTSRPITEVDLRQLHTFVLQGIDDENAGRYRTKPVKISGSKYEPPQPESISPQMQEFGKWLASISAPDGKQSLGSVEGLLFAAVAHTWFVTVHPFADGNGRTARLLLNLILMRFGYPIAIISREDRLRYYDSLEESQASNLSLLLALLIDCVYESLEEYEAAAQEQREQTEWAQGIASKFSAAELSKTRNKYEVWKGAMGLLQAQFAQLAELLNQQSRLARIDIREFGILEFEKYLSLSNYGSAKRTWFFRSDFRSGARVVRYLFFFGSPSFAMKRDDPQVTIFISREEPSNSFFYERLENISAPNVPNYVEIGYNMEDESFVVRDRQGKTHKRKVEQIAKAFFEDVIDKHFSSY